MCERTVAPEVTIQPRIHMEPARPFAGVLPLIRAASEAERRTQSTLLRLESRLIPGNRARTVIRSMHVTSMSEQIDMLP